MDILPLASPHSLINWHDILFWPSVVGHCMMFPVRLNHNNWRREEIRRVRQHMIRKLQNKWSHETPLHKRRFCSKRSQLSIKMFFSVQNNKTSFKRLRSVRLPAAAECSVASSNASTQRLRQMKKWIKLNVTTSCSRRAPRSVTHRSARAPPLVSNSKTSHHYCWRAVFFSFTSFWVDWTVMII